MGVDVSSMTYIGKWVENAEDYFIDKGLLKEGELEGKYGGDLGYMEGFPLEAQAVSYYSDQGYYVGYNVHPSDYKDFDGLIAKFKEITGDEAEVETFSQWS